MVPFKLALCNYILSLCAKCACCCVRNWWAHVSANAKQNYELTTHATQPFNVIKRSYSSDSHFQVHKFLIEISHVHNQSEFHSILRLFRPKTNFDEKIRFFFAPKIKFNEQSNTMVYMHNIKFRLALVLLLNAGSSSAANRRKTFN